MLISKENKKLKIFVQESLRRKTLISKKANKERQKSSTSDN